MIEARVECVCNEYNLPELNLTLRRGDVVWLPEGVARSSRELQHAQRAKAVQVRWEARCEVNRPPSEKAPTPPWLRRRGRGVVPVRLVTAPPQPQIDSGRDAAPQDVEAIIRDVVREEIREALKAVSPAASVVDAKAIAEAVRGAFESLPGLPTGGSRVAPAQPVSDAPMFIPTGIVHSETKTAITLESETSASSSVEDAAAALKAARGTRRRKKE